MLTLKFIFIISLLMVFYIYLGYPVLALFLSVLINRKVQKGDHEPFVTIIIAAYNEEKYIGSTIDNKLQLNYPKDKLEIIVVSDESSDQTDKIVKEYQKQNVKFIRQEPRAGKTSALNLAVPVAKGDILVFSDANSLYAPDALQHLVKNFHDPQVGYVSGKMIYTNPTGTVVGDGCTLYMKYENILRYIETKLGSIVGVDGGVDATRKNLYQPMNPDQLPDFVLPLKVIDQGYRVVYEPEAILKEVTLDNARDEYRMRVRVSLRSFWALYDMRHLFLLGNIGLFAWQLWSHKVLRYLCFIFLIAAYFSNLLLWTNSYFYKVFFILQNTAYLGAIMFPILEKRGCNLKILHLLNYFALLNIAAMQAFIHFVMRKKQAVWTPRKG